MYKLKLQEYRPPERNFTKKKETRLSWFDIMHLIFRFWAKSKRDTCPEEALKAIP